MSSSFNLLCGFIVVRFFPVLISAIGRDGTFYLFACCTLFSVAFVYVLLPETKGKTLEDMENLFSSNNLAGNNASSIIPSSSPSADQKQKELEVSKIISGKRNVAEVEPILVSCSQPCQSVDLPANNITIEKLSFKTIFT